MSKYAGRTNAIREMCIELGIPLEVGFHVAHYYRTQNFRQMRPMPMPSGSWSGTDVWSRWMRFKADTRHRFYMELREFYLWMDDEADRDLVRKGLPPVHRWRMDQ